MKHLLPIILFVLLGCNLEDETRTENCDQTACTLEYRTISIGVKDTNNTPVALDSLQVVDLGTGKVVLTSQKYEFEGYRYPIFHDGFVATYKNQQVNLESRGYVNGQQVLTESYTVDVDCCHVSLVSGTTEVVLSENNYPEECAQVLCTQEFRSIPITIKDAQGEMISLDKLEVINAKNNQLIKTVTTVDDLFKGYVIFDDSFVSTYANSELSIVCRGYKNNLKIVEETYTVLVDCCHVDLQSGTTEVVVQDPTQALSCDEAFCTKDIKSVFITVKDTMGNAVSLDRIEVVDVQNNNVIKTIDATLHKGPGYILINDDSVEAYANQQVQIQCKGYRNQQLIFQRDFLITVDCCHVYLAEGAKEIVVN
ncbi:hypothetical protein [Ochrovirga pacifica]|uniref:hypothetical protein n=1 Tax=Ochrovirga pacifica TaxID=1042376 RepID=UPI0002557F9B|nr:hypothetical protein [Ochrovirga pacifica]